MKYCDKKELNSLIKESQETRIFSNRLLELFTFIFDGISKKYDKINIHDFEDKKQRFLIIMITKIDKLDTTQNCFSYITSCAKNELISGRNKRKHINFCDVNDESLRLLLL